MDGTAVLCTKYFSLFPGTDFLTSGSILHCNQYEKKAIHHIVELPLGYFSQNTSGRLRKVIDDNAGLTEGFLAHQLSDLTGAVVMPVAVIILILVFDWRMGICCLIPMAVSVIFLKQMMGGDNVDFMSKSFTAKRGQVTALVGPSGGGKSTVAKLAAKFYPLDGGKILLGGKDI